ncbi:hypothetical protein [Streptomyces sp. NPDC001978]|uniref:hypothetical protein n=1 Tax=Streptomyces sp. NPDC001978 TaxID=3364627 RepID=UPI0036B00F05
MSNAGGAVIPHGFPLPPVTTPEVGPVLDRIVDGPEHGVRLGTVQETLLIPLYARAVEHRKKDAILSDPRAEEVVASIDYDFARFDGVQSLIGTVLRTALFDRIMHWAPRPDTAARRGDPRSNPTAPSAWPVGHAVI